MRTKIEINGYEIEIEETDGLISVKAERDGEVIEEFTLEPEEGGEGEENDDVQSFRDFDEEEADFDEAEEDIEEAEEDLEEAEEDLEEAEEDTEEAEEDLEGAPKLESFQSFINKKKK